MNVFQLIFFSSGVSVFWKTFQNLKKRMARQDISSTLLSLEEELHRELVSRHLVRNDHNILAALNRYLQPFLQKIKANRLQRRIRERGDFDRMPVEIQQNIQINPSFQRAPVDFSPFLHGIFASLQTHQQSESKTNTPNSMPVAHLQHLSFHAGEHTESECGICRVDFSSGENIVKTSCCGTKFMHINCAIQCLRRSEECPFCRSRRIGFL